jgi:hypothetical protein
MGGGRRSFTTTSVREIGRVFAVLMKKGTPSQRHDSTASWSAAKVSVRLSAGVRAAYRRPQRVMGRPDEGCRRVLHQLHRYGLE